MAITNQQIADAFERIADLLDILGEDAFRVNSYRKVARVVGDSAAEVAGMVESGELKGLPGVGKSSAEKIEQLVRTGKIDLLAELLAKVPEGLPDLLNIQGLGPKTIAKLWRQADVTGRASLADAIEDSRLLSVPGMGAKKVQQLWDAMKFAAASGERARLGDAAKTVERIVAVVRGIDGAQTVTPAGSYRRGCETVGDLDLLCQADKDAGEAIVKAFSTSEELGIQRVLAAGETKGSVVLEGGVQADLRVVSVESHGAAIQYFTGSKAHNVRLREIAVKKGLKLNEYGLYDGDKRIAGADEEGIYAALGLAMVPPELREDRGEIEVARDGKLPELLELADIRGDLHMHTTASDGHESIEAMIAACAERGYKFMAISDHSKGQVQANGLDEKRLAAHRKSVLAAAGEAKGITAYFSCEVDFFKDGSLDFDDKTLEMLDFAIASPHSALSMKRAEATRRIIRAIENPFVRVIGHPSGRLINTRPGMEIDIDEIAVAAAEHNVALEINAHPYRLDLRDVHVRAAIAAGAKIIINTDAHTIVELDNMRFGVITARRGWATAADVVNAWPAAKFDNWVRGE